MAVVLAVTGYIAGLLAANLFAEGWLLPLSVLALASLGAELAYSVAAHAVRYTDAVLPHAVHAGHAGSGVQYRPGAARLPVLGALLAPRASCGGVPPTGLTHRRAGAPREVREARATGSPLRMPTFRHNLKSRFAVFAAIIVVVLGVLLVRLWTMQVLAGEAYAKQADDNRIQEITTEPTRGPHPRPRGTRARHQHSPRSAVLVEPQVRERRGAAAEAVRRCSTCLRPRSRRRRPRSRSRRSRRGSSPSTCRSRPPPTSPSTRPSSRASRWRRKAVRRYPQGAPRPRCSATPARSRSASSISRTFKTYQLGDVVGKSGAESAFEPLLQGDRGLTRFEVDAQGAPHRVVQKIEPVPGRDVQLTIDTKVQRAAEAGARASAGRRAQRQVPARRAPARPSRST